MHAYETWQFWLLIAALIPWSLFVIFYSRVWWYRTSVGRALMLSKLVIVGALVNSIIGWVLTPPIDRHVEDARLRWAIFAVIVGLSCVAGWYQFVNLLREQHLNRHGDSPRRRSSDLPQKGPQ